MRYKVALMHSTIVLRTYEGTVHSILLASICWLGCVIIAFIVVSMRCLDGACGK